MWKTEFPCPFVEKIFGKICGYKRRFWQGSTDHRGTPGKPGRVVTIVEDKESEVWGVAYSFPKESTYEILDLLDYREKGGYDCAMVNFYPIDNRDSFKALLYVGRPVNSSYLGPATLSEMAKQIATAQGPSGANYEYLYNLANALR
ncbi:putative glutathione-specific gamma-glutamylcyclotransferase 2 [Zophobas morio]|uniref:putative glutathione-specific gamma-glutamylcyclotransferase 2 n=1 Tax=Zophobas morio TaxID=2755281 RepID=UPI0030838C9B